MEDVKLHGFWGSPYSARVIWALKVKGVAYEYIEEDLRNKSQQLLKYNPVHKKIPVLVHGGNPVAESTIILEYIDEKWPEPPLLPRDPIERATARFWIKFAEDKGLEVFHALIGDDEKGEENAKQVLKMVEEKVVLENNKLLGGCGEGISMVDICYGSWLIWFECAQEVAGKNLVDPATLPRLCRWVEDFKRISVIRENLPDRKPLLAHMKGVKERRSSARSV